jgi:alkanesulfonate monooxygenase SsuD/methylene tetrahydromethanopterin reductase-like flavin-dependent oxidoreductase (luciferase family)
MIGGGSRRILSLAAREADIVSVNIKTTAEGGFDFASITAEAAMQKVEWVRAAAGDRFADIELNILVIAVVVTDNRREGAERVLREFVRGWGMPAGTLSAEQLLHSPTVLIGTVDQIVDDLLTRREQYGFSYIAQWAPIEAFAPVVARLAGR